LLHAGANLILNKTARFDYKPFFVVFATLLLTLPWLNPFSYGPAPAIAKGLVAWLGVVFCWLVCALSGMDFAGRVRIVAAAWVLAATVSACMGFVQYFGFADSFGLWISNAQAGQAFSNLRQRNHFGTLLAIGLAALLWWQMPVRADSLMHSRGGRWVGMVAVLLGAAVAASGSRTGFIQLVVLTMLCLVWRRGRITLLLALLAYALAAVALPLVLPLLASTPLQASILERFGQNSGRSVLWLNMLHLIAQKPWLGWGWGELQYAHFITLYPGARFPSNLWGNVGNAHNLPLHLAVELGIPFATVFCAALLWLVLRGKPWRERNATRQLAWSVLAVIGAHSMLEYPLWYGPFQLATVLAIWMLWQTRTSRKPETGAGLAVDMARPSVAAMVTGILIAVVCAYTAWDYWRISQIYLPANQRAMPYRDDTLNKIRSSWLFANQVNFAELGITPLTPDNARHINALAKEVLHFSPEASVVQKLLESDALLGLNEEAGYFKKRFQLAYPESHAAWQAIQDSNTGHKIP
jgi:O-antigen ligase